ncbi:hypothetical protein QFC22_000585 [Naganishia vaughanmartiniae]|uniref:Uncharacterized protein n=1 Tax=Naganishia vaughanmartiniae TaxID=1424756 RepID=A0ACC2XP42_9TREE|nr:hypothetical protein QFC22_000585 [Naganishia vaughanmartiniae]
MMLWPKFRALALVAQAIVASQLWSFVDAKSAVGDRVLVVIEPALNQASYSHFWKSLEARGFKLTFKGPKEEQAPLTEYDETKFDHLIMMAPTTTSFSSTLKPQRLVADMTSHHINTLFVLSPSISEAQRDLAREFDIEFQERDTALIDDFHYSPTSSKHDHVLLNISSGLDSETPTTIVPTKLRTAAGPILYNGIVHTLGQNPYLIPVLHAGETAFSDELTDFDEDELLDRKKKAVVAGSQAYLASAMQSRGNARIGWIGSEAMLRDDSWAAKVQDQDGRSYTTVNGDFADAFTAWIFQETGVLKVIQTEHHRVNETESREMYRIKDGVTYSATISEYSTENGQSSWHPFSANDIQLDFTMLDPHVRTTLHERALTADGQATEYDVTFKCPDRHGVFKFVLDYWRPGYTFIHEQSVVSVVPFRHDEYPRFIQGAWPFYTGAFLTSAVFLSFCSLWLYSVEGNKVVAVKVQKTR